MATTSFYLRRINSRKNFTPGLRLETCAFVVIAMLGEKLVLSVPRHFLESGHEFHAFLSAKSQVLASAGSAIHGVLASHYFDMGTSALTLLIFIVPVAVHRLKHGKCAS